MALLADFNYCTSQATTVSSCPTGSYCTSLSANYTYQCKCYSNYSVTGILSTNPYIEQCAATSDTVVVVLVIVLPIVAGICVLLIVLLILFVVCNLLTYMDMRLLLFQSTLHRIDIWLYDRMSYWQFMSCQNSIPFFPFRSNLTCACLLPHRSAAARRWLGLRKGHGARNGARYGSRWAEPLSCDQLAVRRRRRAVLSHYLYRVKNENDDKDTYENVDSNFSNSPLGSTLAF